MKALLSFLALLLTLSAAAMYDGDYSFVEVYDESSEPVKIPDSETLPFVVRLEGETDTEYSVYMKIGNNLGGTMKIEGSTVTVGSMRSTMMMPAKKIYKFELKLNEMLPAMNTISISGDQLTLEGTKGKIVLQTK